VSLGVPENKQIGTLTERQRLALAAVLTAKNAPAGTQAGARAPLTTREGALTAA
jgi:hypothetical protein